jgi:hypothetical protein
VDGGRTREEGAGAFDDAGAQAQRHGPATYSLQNAVKQLTLLCLPKVTSL